MSHKINLDFITFWSSLLVLMVNSHTASGIITDSNDLQCTHIQCPTKCPEDSYLKSSLDIDDDDFEDYEDQIFSHDSYLEEMGNFQEPPPEVEIHDNHSPQHILKERQKREVFFQDDIERCCDDQKCICNKCEDVPKCADGYVAVEIEEGQGTPGNCCSIFRCTKKIECQLGVKQSWWTGKCTKCSCFGETELCMQICPEEEILKNCYSEYLQKPMINGAFWKEGRCTSCSCEQGDRRCLTPVCPQLNCDETITLEDECCPKCMENVVDVRTEIKEEEEISTDAPEINDTVINKIKENSSTIFENHSVVSVVDEIETTSSTLETMTSSSATSSLQITGKISSTFRPLSIKTFQENVSSTDSISASTSLSNSLLNSTLPSALETSSSFPTSTEDSTSTVQLENDLYRTTDDPRIIIEHEHEHDLSTISTITEELTSKGLIEENFFSTVNTTEEVQTSSTPITETSEESMTKDIIIEDNSTQETTSSTLTTYIETTTYNSDTILLKNSTVSSTTPTIDLATASVLDSSSEVASTFTTSDSSEATMTSSNIISTLSETTTTKTISLPTTSMTTTTNTPFDLSNVTLTPNYTTASSSTSTESSISTSTSTTSSPYTATSDSTTLFNLEESTSRSTTTAPEAVKPFFQSYGNIIRDEPSPSNQNQMRIIFDEIDYVVMIVLFTGSLLCISLGLIIRHTKNRKKMYSSIPNSETSLSQTSTNTVLTA